MLHDLQYLFVWLSTLLGLVVVLGIWGIIAYFIVDEIRSIFRPEPDNDEDIHYGGETRP